MKLAFLLCLAYVAFGGCKGPSTEPVRTAESTGPTSGELQHLRALGYVEIVWEYHSPDPSSFFTHARGSAQRLTNGNTLIGESNSGRGFEVTPEGEIVWDYRQPHLDKMGRRAVIIRFYRYNLEWLDALLSSGADQHPQAGPTLASQSSQSPSHTT